MSTAKRAKGKAPAAKASNRRRRSPADVRKTAIEAARKLLLKQGPDAITLKAVAAELRMTHTNLIHHFGSAGELQSALMRDMVSKLTATLEGAIARYQAGAGEIREFVDIVFDAFDKGGAGRLAAWLMVSGNAKLLAPVGQAMREYLQHLEAAVHPTPDEAADVHRRVTSATLFVLVAAFGDAIMGDLLRKMVGRERSAVRTVVGELLPSISVLARNRAKPQ